MTIHFTILGVFPPLFLYYVFMEACSTQNWVLSVLSPYLPLLPRLLETILEIAGVLSASQVNRQPAIAILKSKSRSDVCSGVGRGVLPFSFMYVYDVDDTNRFPLTVCVYMYVCVGI